MVKKRQLNREAVIAQAALLVDEAGGVTAVSLTALAHTLNIRPPSLYNHIEGLEDLQAGLTLFAVRRLIANLRQASLGLVGQEAIMALADAYRRFAQTHPGLYPLTIRAPEPEETELMALAQELVQMLLLLMASLGLHGEEAIHAIPWHTMYFLLHTQPQPGIAHDAPAAGPIVRVQQVGMVG
jgi:AcrR family transcriptional regulator